MEQLFINVLNNAITVSALIIAIIVVRALGKKMPKWITCMLWIIVAVKLAVPIKLESALSLVPTGEPIPPNIVMESNPQISSGIGSVDEIVNPVIIQSFTSDEAVSINPLQIFFHIGAIAWLVGMIVMLTYALTTYMLIRKRVSASVKIDSRVYECDDISDSFILGTISPKVYIPSALSAEAREYILKHEFAHLSRRDHVWKPLGFLILSVYWFNPLCWIAYILLCKDIEYACDEKVTKNIGEGEKADYCRILLENSMPRRMIAACPVAFGGTNVKDRIKNVVNYKKPAFWITLASVMTCAVVGVCFATSKGSKVTSEEQTVELEQAKEGQQVQGVELKNSVNHAEVSGAASSTDVSDQKSALKENTDPEIADLIKKYYEACASGDIETLRSISKGYSENQENMMKGYAKYIEKNDPNKIYTLPGADEGSYLVYVYNLFKLNDYDKPIPQLETFYIGTDEQGKLYIDGESNDSKISNCIINADSKPEVIELRNKVAAEYSGMLKADENLSSILADMRKKVAFEVPGTTYGRIVTPEGVLRTRKSPSVDSEVVGYLAPDEEVEILGEVDGWYKVKLEEGECYIDSTYVELFK
ncbi:MAG: SH3 domain-containing protein [Butyrivibrio sp.]|nr:SH3 domain-containing protein [Butyrivibrio sp.]